MNKLDYFYEGYLWGYLLMVSFPIGALGVRLVHVMTKGAWGIPLKKYYTIATQTWPMAIILCVPLVFGFDHLYKWTSSNGSYLNIPFFTVRTSIYFVIWIGTSFWLNRYNDRNNLSGILAVFYVLAGSFAGIDWVMSLDPRWYSTIFGLLFVIGQALLAFCVLVCIYVFKERPQKDRETAQSLRDQGNLILTLVMLWAYLAFSQYLIIWMGNLPEEIRWYLSRIKGGWGMVAAGIIVGHFFIPFFLLLRRAWKESPFSLAAISVWILAMRIMDMAWMVFPGIGRAFSGIDVIHLGAAVLVISIYGLYFVRKMEV